MINLTPHLVIYFISSPSRLAPTAITMASDTFFFHDPETLGILNSSDDVIKDRGGGGDGMKFSPLFGTTIAMPEWEALIAVRIKRASYVENGINRKYQ